MYFDTKNYLKSNHNHTVKHTLILDLGHEAHDLNYSKLFSPTRIYDENSKDTN